VKNLDRIGIGYDLHRLEFGRRLVLGGVEIPAERGLAGHSDADVLAHAIADAVLGAMGAGDIGQHFPNDDPRWRGVSSLVLLQKVAALVAERRMAIANVDATLCAEWPMIRPHVQEMRRRLAEALAIQPDQVGIQATTAEGLGFVGRGEGMWALAIALLHAAPGTA
jgi:2-C-methyl-D-erythritol 2,4-cyclodiphosphate synthase